MLLVRHAIIPLNIINRKVQTELDLFRAFGINIILGALPVVERSTLLDTVGFRKLEHLGNNFNWFSNITAFVCSSNEVLHLVTASNVVSIGLSFFGLGVTVCVLRELNVNRLIQPSNSVTFSSRNFGMF